MKNEVLSRLPAGFPWRGNIHYFAITDSTNTRAKDLAVSGAPHGTVVIADCQTGGRGRMGRSFHSPAGMGVYLSVILRPGCPATDLMHLTCATAVATAVAVQAATGLRPGIKWTNDLVADGKKLGGILTELTVNTAGKVDFAVVGIGINCGFIQFPQDIRGIATSLEICTQRSIDRADVIAALLTALEAMCQNLSDSKAILAQYRKDCITVGRDISLIRGEEIRHGTALDVDESGALVIRFADGQVAAVNSGEVSIRGMYGYV